MQNRTIQQMTASLLSAFCAVVVLFILGFAASPISQWLAFTLSGVIVGMLFTTISVVINHSTWLSGIDRISNFVFGIGLGAVLFLIGNTLGHGVVFGIDFTKIPGFNGEIILIVLAGGLFGAFISWGTLAQYGFQHSNVIGYFSLAWVLVIGGFFAVALSMLTGSPFIAVAFLTRTLCGWLVARLDPSQQRNFTL